MSIPLFEFHEVANIFPMMSDEEYISLKEDIRDNGLHEPIWLHDNQIIDGRNRYNACVELGIEPTFRTWDGQGDLVNFVVSLNLHRRHLTASQRAIVALDVIAYHEAQAKERMALGGSSSAPRQKGVEIFPPLSQGKARDKAGETVGVSGRYVSDAKRISEHRPDLVQFVRSGDISIPQAIHIVKTYEDEDYKELLYDTGDYAYCKYCYDTHDRWELSGDHHPSAWNCLKCDHATADMFMDIQDAAKDRPYVANNSDDNKDSLPLTAANHAVSDDPDYDGDEWYTPDETIELARSVMGGIDLDPASCDEAQKIIRASEYFTKDDDGLRRDWFGRVWLNPPYSMPLVERFTEMAIYEYEHGHVEQCILIVNNCTDTSWFHCLLSHDYVFCLLRGRTKFWRNGHENFAARQGQVVFYMGDRLDEFCRAFSGVGVVCRTIT